MIRIRKQEKHRKPEWLSPLGMSQQLLDSLPLLLELCQKTLKRLQSLHSLGHMYRITTVKVTAIWILFRPQKEAIVPVLDLSC